MYFRGERSEMAAFLPEQYTTVLEIGCGAGGFGKQLAEGSEHWGIELDATAAALARDRLHRVINADVAAAYADLPDAYFDVVVCNDVIEHLADPESFLASIRGKMKPGACLVASIPNVRYWNNIKELMFQRDWRYRDEGILDRTHLRFFTEKSLHRLMLEQGYEQPLVQGINRLRWQKNLLLSLVVLLSLGSWKDMRYMQFAVKARVPGG